MIKMSSSQLLVCHDAGQCYGLCSSEPDQCLTHVSPVFSVLVATCECIGNHSQDQAGSIAPWPSSCIMSGVDNVCFLKIAAGCDGWCKLKDGMSCPACYKLAKPEEWEEAKNAYNMAAIPSEGDQLICAKEGCWMYVKKGKTDAHCTLCMGGGKAARQGADDSEDEPPRRKRKRSESPSPARSPARPSAPAGVSADDMQSLISSELESVGKVVKRIENRSKLLITTMRHIAEDVEEAKSKVHALKKDVADWKEL